MQTRISSGKAPLGVSPRYFGANTGRDAHCDLPGTYSISPCFIALRAHAFKYFVCAGPQFGRLQNTGLASSFRRHWMGSTCGNGGGTSSGEDIKTSLYSCSSARTYLRCPSVRSLPSFTSSSVTTRLTTPSVLCAAIYSATSRSASLQVRLCNSLFARLV